MSFLLGGYGDIYYPNVSQLDCYFVCKTKNGDIFIFKNGALEDFEDIPAMRLKSGEQQFFKKGLKWKIVDRSTIQTLKDGVYHSYEDKPAFDDGIVQKWFFEGKLHRDGDKPAKVTAPTKTGGLARVEYFKCDTRHRENGPAIINHDGTEEYWQNNNKIEKPKDPAPAQKFADEGEFTLKDGRKGLVKMVNGEAVTQYLKHDKPQKGDWELNEKGEKRYWCVRMRKFLNTTSTSCNCDE